MLRVKDEFLKQLFTEAAIRSMTQTVLSSDTTLANGVPAQKPSTEYSLQLDTDMWQASYLPLKWQTYQVMFNIKAQVIRMSDGAAVWKGFCNANGVEDEAMRLNVTEIAANRGAKLNDILDRGAKKCATDLVAQFRAGAA